MRSTYTLEVLHIVADVISLNQYILICFRICHLHDVLRAVVVARCKIKSNRNLIYFYRICIWNCALASVCFPFDAIWVNKMHSSTKYHSFSNHITGFPFITDTKPINVYCTFVSHVFINGMLALAALNSTGDDNLKENWLWIYWRTRVQRKVNRKFETKLFGWRILKRTNSHWCICFKTRNYDYPSTNLSPNRNRYHSNTALIASTLFWTVFQRPPMGKTTMTNVSMANTIHENATHFLKLNNISINDLNITSENFNDFFKKLIQLSKPVNASGIDAHSNEHDSCDDYCKGFIKDIFGTYRGIHGYLSLLVSIFCASMEKN